MATKPIDDFYKHPQMGDGHLNKCKECNKKDVRNNYKEKADKYRDYDKNRQRQNFKRILDHRYNAIKQRTEGRATRTYKVQGQPMLSISEWQEWTDATMDEFLKIYKQWEKSAFSRKLSPSVDRINPNGSYTVDNIQWLTLSSNSSKGNKQRWT